MTVLFGEDRLSINGACCVPEQGVEYADILKWVSNKYSSFDYDLVKPYPASNWLICRSGEETEK